MSHKTLAEMLDELPHRRLDLTAGYDKNPREWPCHRANLSTWPAAADNSDGVVNLLIGPEWGYAPRCVELSPSEARQLARHLIRTADDVDHLRGRAAADAVRANGGDAMEAAKAHIAETFANSFKGV